MEWNVKYFDLDRHWTGKRFFKWPEEIACQGRVHLGICYLQSIGITLIIGLTHLPYLQTDLVITNIAHDILGMYLENLLGTFCGTVTDDSLQIANRDHDLRKWLGIDHSVVELLNAKETLGTIEKSVWATVERVLQKMHDECKEGVIAQLTKRESML